MATTEATEPQPSGGVTFGAGFVTHLYRWRLLIAGQAVATVVAMVFVLALTGRTTYDYTAHFVLHPDPNAAPGDIANAISVMRQDGPLVQTVLKVLGNDEILRRAGAAARIRDTSKYSISATVSPGSSYFDANVRGHDRKTTEALGKSLETVASAYVEDSFHAFKFDVLGSDETQNDPFPPSPSLLVLVLLLGAVAAMGELFVMYGLMYVRSIVRAVVDETTDREASVEAQPVTVEPVAVRYAVDPIDARRGAARSSARASDVRPGDKRSKNKRAKKAMSNGSATQPVHESRWRRPGDTTATELTRPRTAPTPAAPEQATTTAREPAIVTESDPDLGSKPRSSAES
jgi:hypothetical protein